MDYPAARADPLGHLYVGSIAGGDNGYALMAPGRRDLPVQLEVHRTRNGPPGGDQEQTGEDDRYDDENQPATARREETMI